MAELTADRLRELLDYDPSTGVFKWKRNGRTAGHLTRDEGYVVILISRKAYKAHRLAFLYMTGNFPDGDIDHANRIRNDNRFDNLRVASNWQNCANKKYPKLSASGVKGVYFDKKSKLWRAIVQSERKGRPKIFIQEYFRDLDLAREFREIVAWMVWGDFYHKF